ncbi:transcriptional regulator [Microbacterium sorbitolivorans]|nr:transcriptional regulator [Microbacterium sorbitolivorans]GGF43730.1 transcriptional regulator [Microbacterium sorbitolivorans]
MENMTPRRTAGDRAHSTSRERVLRDVEAHGSASVGDVVSRTGLHENTVRDHLRRLTGDGYLHRETAAPHGRGRPGHRWVVAPSPRASYERLAVSLAAALEGPRGDAREDARAAGATWGEELAARGPRGDGAHGDGALGAVVRVMRDEGFSPEETPAGDVLLRDCPLHAAVRGSRVVCAVHEGMVDAIARGAEPGARASLAPFAVDGKCLLRVSAAS